MTPAATAQTADSGQREERERAQRRERELQPELSETVAVALDRTRSWGVRLGRDAARTTPFATGSS